VFRPGLTLLVLLLAAGPAFAQESVNDGIARARVLAEAGDVDAALKVLRPLAEKNPDDRLPHWWLANVLYSMAGKRREAAEVIDGFLETHSQDRYAMELLLAIADDAMASAEPDVARYCARRLLTYDDRNKDYLFLAARASYLMGDRVGARQACLLIIESWPSDRDAYLLLAKAYEDDGDMDAAIKWYRGLIEERPGFAPARLALASILRVEKRDYDAAERAFRGALDAADPGSQDALEAQLGIDTVEADRVLAHRLREHRGFLMGLVIASIIAMVAASAAVAYVTRARK